MPSGIGDPFVGQLYENFQQSLLSVMNRCWDAEWMHESFGGLEGEPELHHAGGRSLAAQMEAVPQIWIDLFTD